MRVSLEVPVSRLAKALGLLAEALRAPAFADSEVERLVRNRLDEIPHELANPARRAAKELSKELFPATSRMSRPRQGTEETVAAHRRRGRARLLRGPCAAGDGHRGRRRRPRPASTWTPLLADTLGAWTGDTAEPRAVPPITADDTGRVVIVDRPGAVQTQLLIGRIGADRHDRVWPAQVLGTYCLGGTLTSRLDRVLREEKGYTYGVRAFGQVLRSAAGRHGRRDAGHQRLGGHRRPPGPALDDLWKVLRTLAAEGLTDAERDVAVQNLVGVAPLRYETAAAVAGTLADQVEQHLPDDFQAQLYARLAETGTVEATAAVVNAFPADRLVTVLVGDAAQIAEPVKALGIGEVTVVSG